MSGPGFAILKRAVGSACRHLPRRRLLPDPRH